MSLLQSAPGSMTVQIHITSPTPLQDSLTLPTQHQFIPTLTLASHPLLLYHHPATLPPYLPVTYYTLNTTTTTTMADSLVVILVAVPVGAFALFVCCICMRQCAKIEKHNRHVLENQNRAGGGGMTV
jgi:hypothetical protein